MNTITYLMIVTDSLCGNYAFLTYDFNKKIFVDEHFTRESFKTNEEKETIPMIEKIDRMIKNKTLETLMYDEVTEFEELRVEQVHIPENYRFAYDDMFE